MEHTEGYEIKGLAWPGREREYDSNSQVPTGYHNGRQIFYVFGRYPADLSGYADQGNGGRQYSVVDLVICHGDFLNADHNYVHKNQERKGLWHLRRHHDSRPQDVRRADAVCAY